MDPNWNGQLKLDYRHLPSKNHLKAGEFIKSPATQTFLYFDTVYTEAEIDDMPVIDNEFCTINNIKYQKVIGHLIVHAQCYLTQRPNFLIISRDKPATIDIKQADKEAPKEFELTHLKVYFFKNLGHLVIHAINPTPDYVVKLINEL